eukprot:COSAG02_NODE_2733_length_8136_cov_35.604454_4_plen_442_part_00
MLDVQVHWSGVRHPVHPGSLRHVRDEDRLQERLPPVPLRRLSVHTGRLTRDILRGCAPDCAGAASPRLRRLLAAAACSRWRAAFDGPDTHTRALQDCEDKCHNYQCEHDTNDTKQCVENDESGRYPDGTCGSACSPTPPPPKGDWKQCGACGCRGTDLSFLQNSTIHAHDTACDRKGPEGVCHVYAFRLCGPIPMSELLNDDKLPRGCREWAEGPSAENVSLLRYSETDENFCEPFTVCGAGDSGTSSECPLWGRKDKGGIGLELELRFQANAEGMKCSSNPNSSMTITFVMTKGEQPNPQRVYDNSSKDDGTSCEWVARWAGLPENPRPELDIAHENSLYGNIAAVAALGIAAVAILGVCHTMLGRGHKVQSGGRPSEAFADWTPSTERATSDSVASLDSYVTGTGTGSSMSEHLLSARHRDVDSSVDADGHVRNGGSIQ